jgi:hypothetical protein
MNNGIKAKKIVTVTFEIEVEIDGSNDGIFTEEWMENFRSVFYPFYELDDHIKHLAGVQLREMDDGFVEGYGPLDKCGIKMKVLDTYEEIN